MAPELDPEVRAVIEDMDPIFDLSGKHLFIKSVTTVFGGQIIDA
jgi:hypothetical protein